MASPRALRSPSGHDGRLAAASMAGRRPRRAPFLRGNILVCPNEGYAQSFFRFSGVLFFEYSFFILSNFERLGPPSAESQAGKALSVALRLFHLGLHYDVFFHVPSHDVRVQVFASWCCSMSLHGGSSQDLDDPHEDNQGPRSRQSLISLRICPRMFVSIS